ncbi:probable disease resistance protein At4g27220 [Quercus suber]|uniref:probable disease resistance protein At4g27220 n=1 Tax=Quercus suber TaxID=58331 RepID=UPI0032DF964F
MEFLSKEELRKLFLDKMGRDVFNIPNLKQMAEEVLERCAQLALAIVTIVASFKPLIKDFEWKDTLQEFRKSVIRTNDGEKQVLKTLESSYDQLKGVELNQCLLLCALFPKDFKIYKQELIENLIDEGIIERMKSRQEEFDKGYSILRKLENACLLEGGNDFYEGMFVKIHDLVLDLSYIGIESLPNSVYSLEKLTTLRLRGCGELKQASSLAKLTTLRKLDLRQTRIIEVPDGLEMLVNLIFLDLNMPKLKVVPLGILPKISHLQYLTVYWHLKATVADEEDITSLKELETFAGHFDDVDKFSMYIRSLESRRLACYQIRLGMWGDGGELTTFNLASKRIKKLFPPRLLLHLRNLEEIRVINCKQVEEIIGEPSDEKEEKEEEGMHQPQASAMDMTQHLSTWNIKR